MFIDLEHAIEFDETLTTLAVKDDQFILAFFPEGSKEHIPALVDAANRLHIKVCGGMFPSIINENGKLDNGVILNVLPKEIEPLLIHKISTKDYVLPKLELQKQDKTPTAIVILDGLSANISALLYNVYQNYGTMFNFTGGGAGSLSLVQEPCVFDNSGIYQDAALIAFTDLYARQGVQHGWEKIHGPLIATETDANKIIQLNWQDAGDVYKQIVEQDSGRKFNEENFFDICKNYPFGMFKESSEYIVRDPISVDEAGVITCVGEVPENAVLDILVGKSESLLSAAKQAVNDAYKPDGNLNSVLIFDCISRVLFLEDDFIKEIEAVKSPLCKEESDCKVNGVLSLGEISSIGKGQLDFYNKTIVSCLLYE